MLDYRDCRLCPRECGVDRSAGARGFCRMPAQAVAAAAALHFWEEPVISGTAGSGAVFFSGCTLRCAFCQNAKLSHEDYGKPVSSAQLRKIFLSLIDQGAQNINLVTPTQFLPSIVPALQPKLPVPVVYNCGGYERVETLRSLCGLVDIYLPDFKYADNALARTLSSAPDYFETAAAAISEMYRQTGPYRVVDGRMTRGVLIRHLVLPGQVGNSLDVLSWIASHFPAGSVPVSLMRQYTPMGSAREIPGLDRRVTQNEYAAVLSWMTLCGLHEGFTQEASAAQETYIPEFHLQGLE